MRRKSCLLLLFGYLSCFTLNFGKTYARPAQKFHDLAMSRSDPNDRLFGQRMMGVVKHFIGDQISAGRYLEQVLAHYAATDRGRDVIRFHDVIRFGTDLRVSTRVLFARVLWLRGFSDQAVRAVELSLAEAEGTGHAHTVCYALSFGACPIALWVGNVADAARYAGALLDHSRRHSLPLAGAFGSRFHKIIALRGGDLDTTPPNPGVDEIVKPSPNFRFKTGLTELAEALAHVGGITDGLAMLGCPGSRALPLLPLENVRLGSECEMARWPTNVRKEAETRLTAAYVLRHISADSVAKVLLTSTRARLIRLRAL